MKKGLLLLFIGLLYAAGRLYINWTDGFSIKNISSDLPYDSKLEVPPLSDKEQKELYKALNQHYHYLGKGCQSYVFLSDDKKYVLKFFKYQRFRPQEWLSYLPPLPALLQYRMEKHAKRQRKLKSFMKSWHIAATHLKAETGLLFMHLNKSSFLNQTLILYDKTKQRHEIELDQMEFYVQSRATMLEDTLIQMRDHHDITAAKTLINKLLDLVMREHQQGFGDNDHALMQNTGVLKNGNPIHIDIGQFTQEERFKTPAVQHQELFTKTYHFLIWLDQHYPEAAHHLKGELQKQIGQDAETMRPLFRPHGLSLPVNAL